MNEIINYILIILSWELGKYTYYKFSYVRYIDGESKITFNKFLNDENKIIKDTNYKKLKWYKWWRK